VHWWGVRLLTRAPGVFDTEAWPFRLTFDADATGEVNRLRVDGPALAWRRFSGVYEKLA
jgi:hypothetical protein